MAEDSRPGEKGFRYSREALRAKAGPSSAHHQDALKGVKTRRLLRISGLPVVCPGQHAFNGKFYQVEGMRQHLELK